MVLISDQLKLRNNYLDYVLYLCYKLPMICNNIYFKCIQIFDNYIIFNKNINPNFYYAIIMASLNLAYKHFTQDNSDNFFQFIVKSINKLIKIKPEDIINIEFQILELFKFDLSFPTYIDTLDDTLFKLFIDFSDNIGVMKIREDSIIMIIILIYNEKYMQKNINNIIYSVILIAIENILQITLAKGLITEEECYKQYTTIRNLIMSTFNCDIAIITQEINSIMSELKILSTIKHIQDNRKYLYNILTTIN